ncbi:ATP-dependent DNA helicase RecG [Neomicrococcus aestuarii]|uniref:Probable DNA 3'-5' helicase RecG n=1 Tax=Neomicrococcus aestuarii TaxID=556325 RepID=A0A7W8X0Y1_9MICC|nr:ATP-dependent DNA helicase RecG [Neomicrococcus aestuarii]MBB5512179.1 ATP-dependent DNA helicase RecG [Neomicrococcus aestuarii]
MSETFAGLTPLFPLSRALGDKRGTFEKAFGYTTVEDLLYHFPRRYLDVAEISPIGSLEIGEDASVYARVERVSERKMNSRKGFILEVIVTDLQEPAEESFDFADELSLTFFNGYQARKDLVPGVVGVFSGVLSTYRQERVLTQPEYTLLADQEEAAARPFPIYSRKQNMAQERIRTAIGTLLDQVDTESFPDPIPAEVLRKHHYPDLVTALEAVHRPENVKDAYRARRRFAFQEAFFLQLALAERRAAQSAERAVARPSISDGILADFDASLPYQLTPGQSSVGQVLAADIEATRPMNRLLQGEVGSGKTLVALRAMLQVIDAGGQAALVAPTEVLAQQHAQSISAMFGPLGRAGQLGGAEKATRVELLTGSMGTAAKRQALLNIATGDAGIVIGTHALFSDNVSFFDLGLVVVDEQHRFGVEQRDTLRNRAEITPHMLVMTATPIPRTVAMTVFGDLEPLVLEGLPSGRKPVKSFVVPTWNKKWLDRMIQRMSEEVAAGHQVFVVCPRISETDSAPKNGEAATAQRTTVDQMVAFLSQRPELKTARIDALHGQLHSEVKTDTMDRFARHQSDILVSTTVIEVGVDIPNATIMAIIDAENFGTAQIHQLRGRIGRGGLEGTCFLVSSLEKDHASLERLERIAQISDGFVLAEEDLKVRREGNVLGTEQAGARSTLRELRVMRDAALIGQAREDAEELVAQGSLDRYPGLRAAIDRWFDADTQEYLERG